MSIKYPFDRQKIFANMSDFELLGHIYICMKKTFTSISELKSLPMSKLEEQTRERRIKPVDKLTLADDYHFGEVMHKKDVCAGVVERLC